MNRVIYTRLIVVLVSLTYVFSSLPSNGQWPEEISVPEPTQLHATATAAGSKLIWSKALGNVKSNDANAKVLAIEVEGSNGDHVRGVRIALENSTSSDQIYITDTLLPNFRVELQHLEYKSMFDDNCESQYRCIRGLARCRPSQTDKQAYCPGRYTTPNAEDGFVLSTPRDFFSFPSVEASQLDALIADAVQLFE